MGGEGVNVQIIENNTRNEEERQMITDILVIMRSGRVDNGAGFKRGLTEKGWQNGRRG